MINFPTLFKKTATGAIQMWAVQVEHDTIITHFGHHKGQRQTTKDVIKSGKSIGKKNETDVEEQALKEAQSRWEKKKKSGYVESLADAKADKVDEIIEGGVVPMLAKVYEDYAEVIKYPVFMQPKLDGARMLAVFDKTGSVSLWSRTRKRITSVPHIEKTLEALGLNSVVLDGELYQNNLKHDFEKLMSAARKQKPTPESALLEYHIYDIVSPSGFEKRVCELYSLLEMAIPPIHIVETHTVETDELRDFLFERFTNRGYEGAMIRSPGTHYEHKRSAQLLKMKKMQDAEFEIVGLEEGRGKLAGHVGAFICKTKSGKEFNVKMMGSLDKLKEYWESDTDYSGKMLTVKYQSLTAYGVPRFPVGLRIRESEDL